jgi:hypothetical protein
MCFRVEGVNKDLYTRAKAFSLSVALQAVPRGFEYEYNKLVA